MVLAYHVPLANYGFPSRQLLLDGLHPFAHLRDRTGRSPPSGCRSPWKVFLNTDDEIIDRIDYVEDNPLKDGKPRQQWDFVTCFPRPVPRDVRIQWDLPDDLNLLVD